MTEELYINGEAVDLKPDATTTLNYKSNLLGDISKITSSNSQTIQCPKTSRNRLIFDNPGAPAYVSDKRYKRYSARLVRNGIEVVQVGYAVLLSAAEHYEIGLYWGIMANFQAWVDKAAKLNELAGTEALKWDKNITATALSTVKSQGYGYAQYDCGVSDASLTNIHPSATAWWILNKIASQAGFTFEMPDKYEATLRSIAVPCLSKHGDYRINYALRTGYLRLDHNTIQGSDNLPNTIWATQGGDVIDMAQISGILNNRLMINVSNVDKIRVEAPYGWGIQDGAIASNNPMFQIRGGIDIDTPEAFAVLFEIPAKYTNMSALDEILDVSQCNYIGFCITKYEWMPSPTQVNMITRGMTIYGAYDLELIYPNTFSVVPNLPEITQIDFIKAICAMLGIFVVPDPTNANNVKFVSFDILQENKGQAHDWSDQLVSSNEDEPKTVEFKVNDYCRNNFFKYKEDDTVATNGDGNLTIASEVLEKEKTVITLPFAASDGSKVPHYKLNGDRSGVESVKVKDRIMRLIDNGAGLAALTFDSMDFRTLLTRYYDALSRLLNNAIATTEAIMLNEYQLKTLDYTTPFYLRQYGKYYGIISVQSTAGKACEVKAVQLPETVAEEPERPSQSVSIGWKTSGSAVYITASAPPASSLVIEVTPYAYDGVALGQQTITLPVGQVEVFGLTITRVFGRLEINSITPEYDYKYSYFVAEQPKENE